MPTTTLPIPFTPSPDAVEQILDDCTDPALSLRDIAARHHITSHTLSLWLATPEIRDRLDRADAAVCHRIRLVANAQLQSVASTLATILLNYKALIRATTTESPTPESATGCPGVGSDGQPVQFTPDLTLSPLHPVTQSPLHPALLRLRLYEAARKTASLLVRLARTQPASHQPRTHSPEPRNPANRTDPTNLTDTATPAARKPIPSLEEIQALFSTFTQNDIATPNASSAPASAPAPSPQTSTPPPSAHSPTPKPPPPPRIPLAKSFLAAAGKARLQAQAHKAQAKQPQPLARTASGPAP